MQAVGTLYWLKPYAKVFYVSSERFALDMVNRLYLKRDERI